MKINEKIFLPIQKCFTGHEVKNLSDIELIAVIIGSGSKKASVLELASKVYSKFDGINGIKNAGISEISECYGIGKHKAVKLKAAIEIGKRCLSNFQSSKIIDNPLKVWKLLLPDIIGQEQEVFRVLLLNTKNSLIRNIIVSMGTISEAIIHPREIYREAVKESAASIIIIHNHPSGVLQPSPEDIKTTKRVIDAGKIIGIPLLDHIIVSEISYLSMQEHGYI